LVALGPSGAALATMATGQVAVTENGVATYSYPMRVPPGIAGLVPQIGLSYSSGAGVNGPVGVGWALQGISLITRCSATQALDQISRSVENTVQDRLCLDGKRLIQTDANGAAVPVQGPLDAASTYGRGGTEYRTDLDSYSRVRAYGTLGGNVNNGPEYFIVWTKSGQRMTFGRAPAAAGAPVPPDGVILAQGRSVAVAWLLTRVSDVAGNYMDFSYEVASRTVGTGETATPRAGMEWNLREIRYTGNGAQAPANSVLFEYGDGTTIGATRPDASESYDQGANTVTTRVLQRVTTRVNGASNTPVTVYRLSYTPGPNTNRLRLSEIRECAANGTTCMPPTQFTYSAGPSPMYTRASAAVFPTALVNSTLHDAAGNTGVLTGDFNGDGRDDILRWSSTPANNQLWLSSTDGGGGPTFVNSAAFNIRDRVFFDNNGCRNTTIADFNADGLADVFRWASSTVGARDGLKKRHATTSGAL